MSEKILSPEQFKDRLRVSCVSPFAYEAVQDHDAALRQQLAEATRLIANYVNAAPAFRSKSIGAPGSVARERQELHVMTEDDARAFLATSPAPGKDKEQSK